MAPRPWSAEKWINSVSRVMWNVSGMFAAALHTLTLFAPHALALRLHMRLGFHSMSEAMLTVFLFISESTSQSDTNKDALHLYSSMQDI